MNTVVALRWLGLSRILGALLFIAGDLLYQYIPGSSKSLAEKNGKPTLRPPPIATW